MQKETFEVAYEYEGERLDKYVSILFPEQSRSFFQKLIKDGNVSVNDKVQKANYRLKTEDLVTVEIPDAVETQILPEDIPLDILYEDDDLLVVNKPKVITVAHWSMRLCITARIVFPVSTEKYVRESYTVLIWIPQAL